MASLGWLLNLDFAASSVIEVTPTEGPSETRRAQPTAVDTFLEEEIFFSLSLILPGLHRGLPPIMTPQQLVQLINHSQPKYEGWFVQRVRSRIDSQSLANEQMFQQVSSFRVTGLVWHYDLKTSSDYIQDKTDEIIRDIARNMMFRRLRADFSLEPFGQIALMRCEISFDVISTIKESRNF